MKAVPVAVLALALSVAYARQPQVEVIAEGLSDPRFLYYAEESGHLYVTEAGSDAAKGISKTGSVVDLWPKDSSSSASSSSASALWNKRTLVALDSVCSDTDEGLQVDGPVGIAALDGDLYVTVQSGINQRAIINAAAAAGLSNAAKNTELQFGHVLRIEASSLETSSSSVSSSSSKTDRVRVSSVANVASFSQSNEALLGYKDDTNPYGMFADVDTDTVYVADAAANTLVAVRNGMSRVIAYFPFDRISDSVPTTVTKGPDGFLYVGLLRLVQGFVFGPGQSEVYRIDPRSSAHNVTADECFVTGLTCITNIAFDHDYENLYVVEIYQTPNKRPSPVGGNVVKIPIKYDKSSSSSSSSSSSDTPTAADKTKWKRLGVGALQNPNGIAISSSGDVYVTDVSTKSGIAGAEAGQKRGRVVKLNW